MKLYQVIFCLSLGLTILVSAQTTVEITTAGDVTQVSTVYGTPLATAADYAAATNAPAGADTDSTDGNDTPEDPNEAGASGKESGAFTISKGGIAAIIAVASVVGAFGLGSVILWYVAKKRSWEVRASLRRVSRRLTGRLDDSRSKRQSRRTAVRMQSPPASKDRYKERDLEKGRTLEDKKKPSISSDARGKVTTTVTSTFEVETPVVKSWRAKLFGGRKSSR